MEHKIVRMKLLQKTVRKARALQEMLNLSNRADAVSRAIEIALEVVKALESGKRVVLVSENGAQEQLVIPDPVEKIDN